jgi:NADPH:quinone reductase-like Zn-dependent oxidoreductase
VGSIAIQLAKQVAKLEVIATASRPETVAWCEGLGADAIANHQDLTTTLESLGHSSVDYILCCNNTDQHWLAMTQAIKPQGLICSIVENQAPLDLAPLKSKSAGFVWEFMFTRAMYQTPDMAQQGALLNTIALLVDAGTLKTTCNEVITPINAENLRAVHALIEQGKTVGKIVLSDWN